MGLASDPRAPILTARKAGLTGCRRCARVWPRGQDRCGLCGAKLMSRDTLSLQRVWAWWIAGLLAYVPANIYPMLTTRTLVIDQSDTIVGGAIELAHHGSYGVAFIIILASVVIPVSKFAAIAYLATAIRRGFTANVQQRFVLYEIVEYIGRWSMIDVFVVAILSALVQLSSVATIEPGPASLTFALSVAFTMLSAQSFDSRMFWDSLSAAEETAAKDAGAP